MKFFRLESKLIVGKSRRHFLMVAPGSEFGHFIDVRVDVVDVNDRHLDAVVGVGVVQRPTQNLATPII